MRFTWVICGLSILVSMGVILIIFGQQRLLAMLAEQNEELKLKAKQLDNVQHYREYQRDQLEKQREENRKSLPELEADLAKMAPNQQTMQAEVKACQAEKTKKNEELAGMQEALDDTEATFQTEREAWTGEITALKQQMEQRSTVCAFVKDSEGTQKLCPPKEALSAAGAQPEPPTDAGAPNPK